MHIGLVFTKVDKKTRQIKKVKNGVEERRDFKSGQKQMMSTEAAPRSTETEDRSAAPLQKDSTQAV